VAGPARPLGEAVKGMTHVALKTVDFSLHWGTHPRLGVVDHISVHPLRGASLAEAAEFARSVGRQLASTEESESHLAPSPPLASLTTDTMIVGVRELRGAHSHATPSGLTCYR